MSISLSEHGASRIDPYVMLDSQLKDFFECVYGVLSADGISLHVAYVVVGGKHDLDSILRN